MVTTVTVTTVTTVTAIAAMGVTAALSVVSAIVLIFLLSTRELALAHGGFYSTKLGRFVMVAIVPFLLTFGIVLVLKIIEILS